MQTYLNVKLMSISDIMRKEIIVPDGIAEYKGYKLEVYHDEYETETTRDYDNLGKIITWHKNYDFTDNVVKEKFSNLTESPETFLDYANKNKFLYKSLYMYDHSGISFSLSNNVYPFNDRWDSGQVGYIFTTPEDIKKWFKVKEITNDIKEKVYEDFENEIKELNKDVVGDSFYYILYKNNEQIDSLSGIRYENILKDDFWENLESNNEISKEDINGLRKNFKWVNGD